MGYLIHHRRAVADPFSRGQSASQLGLMMHMTLGRVFPWRDGGVALLRRYLYPDLGEWMYCGVAVDGGSQVTNYPGMTHSAEQAYLYTAVVILGNGMISPMHEPVRLDFDDQGDLISPGLPMFPQNVVAIPLAAGKYRVLFEYDPYGQSVFPTDFQVFEGADAESVDYETPLTDSVTDLSYVSYIGTRQLFSFTTAAYDDLSSHVFSVRARNVTPVSELNTYTSEAKTARVTAPAAAAAPTSVAIKPYSRLAG